MEVNKGQEQRLIEAFERIQRDNERLLIKREQKLWKETDLPLNLSQALNGLTKEELNEIARKHDINKISTLNKKELILKLEELLPGIAREFFTFFDKERYDIIRKISKNDGYVLYEEKDSSKAEYFRSHGVIFTGKKSGKKLLIMPMEILELFREIDNYDYIKTINRNQEWIDLTHGLLYYYGVMNLVELMKMIEKYTESKPPALEYLMTINHGSQYYMEIERCPWGYCNAGVLDDEELLEKQRSRSNLDYYPFSKANLLKAGKPGYIDKTQELKNLLSFLRDGYDLTKEEADEVARECLEIIAGGEGFNELMEHLQLHFEFPSLEVVQALGDKVVKLYNATPMWELKGYSPNELRKKEKPYVISNKQSVVCENNPSPKIGRNHYCPCGSEKKYKRCCGK